MTVIYFESVDQLIIGVVLPNGRRMSIDIKVPIKHVELMDAPADGEQTYDVLVSGTVTGRSVN